MKIKQLATLIASILLTHISASATEPESVAQADSVRVTSRGLVDLSNVYIPKGKWSVGGAVSYSTHYNDSYQFLVIDNINSEGYSFNVSPMFTYTYANNQAVGARLVYERSLLRIDSAELSFGDDDTGVSLSTTDFYSLSHNYTMQAILRQYIPVGSSRRFAMFNEVQLGVGGSQSKFVHDSPVTGTYAVGRNFSLGLTPGVTAFVSNNIVMEVSVGVLGLSYRRVEQVHNQVTLGDVENKAMNFKINILSIGFGVGFYI